MKGPKTNDVDPEELIPAAIGGNKEALELLMVCFWLTTMLTQICERAGRRFHVDDHELRVFVEEKLRNKIRSIKNPTNLPWCDRLTAWCKVVVRNRGLALVRARKPREAYRKRVIRENVISKRCGEEIMASRVKTPLEELMDKERELRKQRRQAEIAATAKKLIDSFPPGKKRIAELWGKGKSPKQIIQETGRSASTVYRILEEIEKAIVEEIGAKEAIREQPKLLAGLQKLVGGEVR